MDDHSKNFSWLMDKFGNWSLAPAYDLTFSSTSIGEHSTKVSGEGAKPGRRHLVELAKEFSIKNVDDIIQNVQEALSQWSAISKACGVKKSSRELVQTKLNQLKNQ